MLDTAKKISINSASQDLDSNKVPRFLSRSEYTHIIKTEEEHLKRCGIPFDCFKPYEEYVKIYKKNLDNYM